MNPQIALDKEKMEPNACLDLKITRAKSLKAADINGLSDPFVKIKLDGQDLGLRTKAQQNTLAPVWDEHFEVPVFSPLSVLTLEVYDEDFGTSLGAIDFLGLDDDFIGWVDIQLGKLPV